MKITVLAENTSKDGRFGAEHGLSLYIEANGRKILFDMGQTDLFAENAEKLGVDLAAVNFAVLSHGHYDHGGGLKKFLELNKNAPVYLNIFAFEPHYNGMSKYIGLDASLKENGRLIFTGDEHEIEKGIGLYSCNELEKKFDLGSFGLNMLKDRELLPENFRHEQYMLIEEGGKRVLFSGCSHKGVLNIVNWFKPDVLVGGFHFSKLPLDEKLKDYSEYLNSFDTDYYTLHCTGAEQYNYMKKYMRRLNYISSGESTEV